MPLSPKTQQITQGQQAPEDKDAVFKQLFEEQARIKLVSKFPGIDNSIVTFKVLESNPDTGDGVGAFILSVNDKTLYIPVSMTEGQISPVSVFYSSDDQLFLPLSKEWIEEVQKDSVPELGIAEKEDPTSTKDVDITSLVRPPYSGRFVYASAKNELKLPKLLNKLAYQDKLPFIQFLKKHTDLFKTAVAIYGADEITAALRRDQSIKTTKAASVSDLIFITKDHLSRDFIGDKLDSRFAGTTEKIARDIAVKGFSYIDKRAQVNEVVDSDTTLRLHAIQKSGFYDVYKWDGSRVRAMVIFEPVRMPSKDNPYYKVQPTRTPRRWGYAAHAPSEGRTDALDRYTPPKILVVMPSGEYAVVYEERLLAKIPDSLTPESAGFTELSGKAYIPKVGETGLWVKIDKDGLKATDVVHVKSVLTSGDKKVITSTYGDKFIISPDVYKLRRIDDNTTLVPTTYTFFKTKEFEDDDLARSLAKDPTELQKYVIDGLKTACFNLKVRKGPFGYVTNFDGLEHNKELTTMKIAAVCNLRVKDAEYIVKRADEDRFNGYVVPALIKTAQPPGAVAVPPPQAGGASPPGAMPPEAAGAMPPEAAGAMPPEAAGAMPPEEMQPQQSPELEAIVTAINDVQGKLTAIQEKELAAMQERAKNVALQNAALESVGARVQEVLQGVPPEQSPTLQTLDATGVATGASQEAGAPEAAQQGPSGQVPEAAGGMPPGGMPPGGMPAEAAGISPEEANPEAMQAAAEVPPPEAFDTAALSQLGRLSSVSSTFSDYVPELTQSLDHLSRILLTLQMNRSELAKQLSESEINKLEDNIQTVLTDTGNLLLTLNKKITTLEPTEQ